MIDIAVAERVLASQLLQGRQSDNGLQYNELVGSRIVVTKENMAHILGPNFSTDIHQRFVDAVFYIFPSLFPVIFSFFLLRGVIKHRFHIFKSV